MKIVPYNTLIPDVAGIQPGIAWLLANAHLAPSGAVSRSKVTKVLEDLQLKYAKLQGKIIELESGVQEFAEGDVIVVLPDGEGKDLEVTQDALLTALAEVIVQRGEQELEKERLEKNDKFHELYGGKGKVLQCDPTYAEWRFTKEDVERWKNVVHSLGYWSVNDAIEQTRIDHEEGEALVAAKAAVGAHGEIIDECIACGWQCDSLQCDSCVPDIDLDGQLLD